MQPWSLLILTGGTGRRLGGIDKAGITLDGRTLLDTLLDAMPPAVPVVVCGSPTTTSRPVVFRSEHPPGGGPAAGICAALPEVTTPLVGVIAVDMPRAVPVLLRALQQLDGSTDDVVVPVDPDGHRQLLCSAWRTSSLANRCEGTLHGQPVRTLFEGATVHEMTTDAHALLHDIDTPADLQRARGELRAT